MTKLTTDLPKFHSDNLSINNLCIESCSYKSSVTADKSLDGDFHVSAQIMVDLKGKNKTLKVRTLLDTGCGTNFIFSELLHNLHYKYICTVNMEVFGINTSETRPTDLVEIFLDNPNCPVKSIRCYTIPHLVRLDPDHEALKDIYFQCRDLPNFSNPLTTKACHGTGVGLIIGPGTIRDISFQPPSFYKDFLIDHTYFGAAASGRSPTSKFSNSYLANLHRFNHLPELQETHFFNEHEVKEQLNILNELKFLVEKESLGIKKEEIHANDQTCLDQFKQSVIYDVRTINILLHCLSITTNIIW